jgi:anti-sigma-K factor RskA
MDHDQLKELLPLAAMDRLEGDEAAALAAHLEGGCDECTTELRAFRETLALIALADADAQPADQIWQRLELRLEAPAPIRSSERTASRGVARVWRLATGFAIAAALMMTTLAGYYVQQSKVTRRDSLAHLVALETHMRDLADQLRDRDLEVISLRTRIAASGEMTRALLAPDVHMIKLVPMPMAPKAAGVVAMSEAREQCMATVMGLPPLPADKTYELWWIGARRGPMRAATFNLEAHGGATVAPAMPPEGEKILASAITLEPLGGTDKPTGAMYLKGVL